MKKWHITNMESVEKVSRDAMAKALDHIYSTFGVDVSNAISELEIENFANAVWEKIPQENKQI